MGKTWKITHIWTEPRLKQHFMKIISNSQLRNCPVARLQFLSKLNDLVFRQKADDQKIYNEMFDLVQNNISQSSEWKKKQTDAYRANQRCVKLVEILKKCKKLGKIECLLDIGCADGKITAEIGKVLGIEEENVYGCDILDIPFEAKGYVRTKLFAKNYRLPYASEKFDMVTTFMSLHHIEHFPKMMREIKRILKPGGILFVREHNCLNKNIETILDVVHGFYTMVWSNPKECNSLEECWLNYFSSDQLKRFITSFDLVEIYNDSKDENYWKLSKFKNTIPNPLRYYYAVYQKKN